MKLLVHPLKDHPLKGIIESTRFPHARTLRTSFVQKIKDAFFVFAGTILGGTSTKTSSFNGEVSTETYYQNHAGLLDYATLFIPRLINYLFALAWWETNNAFLNFLGALLFIINGPLLLARYLIAGALTIISLPIILAVEFVSYFIMGGKELEEKILHLTVEKLEEGICGVDSTTSLKMLLSEYPRLTLEDILIQIKVISEEEVEIVIHRPAASEPRYERSSTDPIPIGSFSLIFQKDILNNCKKEGLKAIFELGLKSTNSMRTSITDQLEKENTELFNKLLSFFQENDEHSAKVAIPVAPLITLDDEDPRPFLSISQENVGPEDRLLSHSDTKNSDLNGNANDSFSKEMFEFESASNGVHRRERGIKIDAANDSGEIHVRVQQGQAVYNTPNVRGYARYTSISMDTRGAPQESFLTTVSNELSWFASRMGLTSSDTTPPLALPPSASLATTGLTGKN